MKMCGANCVAADPTTGCAAKSCTACNAPVHGTATCTAGACDFTCNTNYIKNTATCDPAPSCTDGTQNGTETDKDCGGSCPACATGLKCKVDGDCASGPCVSNVCTCAPKTCTTLNTCSATATDGCGAPLDCSQSCVSPALCYQSKCCTPAGCNGCGLQTDGCGTSITCPLCADGASCKQNGDCVNGTCASGTCVSCTDGKKNNGETDVDCGGPNCPKCANNKTCSASSDCQSGKCCTPLDFGSPCDFIHAGTCQ
jgi:hypothetical protein